MGFMSWERVYLLKRQSGIGSFLLPGVHQRCKRVQWTMDSLWGRRCQGPTGCVGQTKHPLECTWGVGNDETKIEAGRAEFLLAESCCLRLFWCCACVYIRYNMNIPHKDTMIYFWSWSEDSSIDGMFSEETRSRPRLVATRLRLSLVSVMRDLWDTRSVPAGFARMARWYLIGLTYPKRFFLSWDIKFPSNRNRRHGWV